MGGCVFPEIFEAQSESDTDARVTNLLSDSVSVICRSAERSRPGHVGTPVRSWGPCSVKAQDSESEPLDLVPSSVTAPHDAVGS